MKTIKFFTMLILVLTLSSCKWWHKDDEEKNPFEGMTAKELYTDSQHYLAQKRYGEAAKRMEAIETMYPFSDYTEETQMDLIYAYYQNEDYPSAAATAERFIHLYPRAERVDYAYYLKGMANFKQNRGSLVGYLPLDVGWRDPGTQAEAYTDFSELCQRFPNSQYKASSLQHMIYLRNMLARHELLVSQYYFDHKMYVAAIDRANYLIQNYSQAPCVQNALVILHDANKALGFNEAADEAMKVYQANYNTDVMVRGHYKGFA